MSSQVRLPKIARSPSTVQYQRPRNQPKKFYKPRFILSKELRDKTINQPWLYKTDPMMPPYPYEKNVFFSEANQGLYGGATIQSGNKISKGRNKGKTLRKWFPNVRVERIQSEALQKELVLPITARVMRTIRKCGGLDQYLLGTKAARIKELGILGWKLRWHVMRTAKYQSKFDSQRRTLGLSPASSFGATFESVWNDPEQKKLLIEEQQSAWEKLREKAVRYERHIKDKWSPADGVAWSPRRLGTLMTQSPKTLDLPQKLQEAP